MDGTRLAIILLVCGVATSRDLKNDERNNPSFYKIGGVLSNNESEADFQNAIQVRAFESIDYFYEINLSSRN